MAKQVDAGELLKTLGGKAEKAFETHKKSTTKPKQGMVELPAGINGIAKLTSLSIQPVAGEKAKFKGKPQFVATGVIVAPTTHDGVPIRGLFTRLTELLCDTPDQSRKTVDEHIDRMLMILRGLGLNTAGLKMQHLQKAMDLLVKKGVYFRFRTWKGDKQTVGKYANKEPKVNHQWEDVVEYEEDETPKVADSTPDDEELEDNSEPDEAEPDEAEEEAAAYKAKLKDKKATAKPAKAEKPVKGKKAEPEPDEDEDEGDEPFTEMDDLDSLAERADEGDKDALKKLRQLALEAGISLKQQKENYETFAELAEAVKGDKTKDEEDEDDEDEENDDEAGDDDDNDEDDEADEEPEVVVSPNEVYSYEIKVKNPKTNRTELRTISVLTTKVNTKARTCVIKNLEDGKTLYKDVPFSDLSQQ